MLNSIHTNHLRSETSPYLLQHVHNPVDWYPWEQEALDKARNFKPWMSKGLYTGSLMFGIDQVVLGGRRGRCITSTRITKR